MASVLYLSSMQQITRIPPEGLSEDVISSLVNKRSNQFKFSPLVLENGELVSSMLILNVVTIIVTHICKHV